MTASINASTTAGVVVTSDTSGSLALQTAGTTAVTINTSQYVGIGTSSPAYPLDITANANASIAIGQSSDDPFVWLDRSDGGSNRLAWRLRESSTRQLIFETGTSTTKYGQTFTQAMTLDNNGRLGIGTTSPATPLDVRGDSSLGGTNTYLGGSTVFQEQRLSVLGTTSGSTGLAFSQYTGSSYSERMRIDSSGNLLVGTTSYVYPLSVVKSTTNSRVGYLRADTSSYTDAVLILDSSTSAGTTFRLIEGYAGSSSLQFRVYGNGNVQNTNNSYGSISDAKLKENIVDATPKLADLLKVQVRNYNLKGDYENHKQIGVIAQELEQVFPSMIDESPDKDKDGNDLGTTTKSVKYSVFVPMLIKAIQELNTLVTAQAAEITALKAKVGI